MYLQSVNLCFDGSPCSAPCMGSLPPVAKHGSFALHVGICVIICEANATLLPTLSSSGELMHVQVTSSFKSLTQAQPDLTMSFVSEVAKKMGLPHKQTETDATDSDSRQGEYGLDNMPELVVDSPESRMDVDCNRYRQ